MTTIGIEAAHANKIQRTGVENVCFALIQEFKKQIPSETKVILYSNQPLRGERRHSRESGNPDMWEILPSNWSVKVLRWPLKKLWSQIRLSLEFLFHPPDIFFAPGQLIPFFCPAKTVVIIHDSAFLAYPEAYNFWGRQYLKWMNKRIIKKSWKIITSSEFNKSEIKKYYGERAAEKVLVIPFAYDDKKFNCHCEERSKFTPAKAGAAIPSPNCHPEFISGSLSGCCHSRPPRRRNPVADCHPELIYEMSERKENAVFFSERMSKYGQTYISGSLSKKYSISKPFIISIGRLEKKKNTVNIIRAFNKIKSRDNIQYSILNVKLLLVGSRGVGYEEVAAEIDNSPHKNDIIRLGWVSSDDISYLLNQASAFVFPSLYEGFGLPILEAMACGCPVVASDIPALREVGGEAALYADPLSPEAIASRLADLFTDENFRQKKIAEGLGRVKNFSWLKTAEMICLFLR